MRLAAQQAPECQKIKDRGLPPSGLFAGWEKDERLVGGFRAGNVRRRAFVCLRQWYGQAVLLNEYDARKSKLAAAGLKDGDEIVCVQLLAAPELLLVSRQGMGDPFCRGRHSRAGAHSRGREGHDPRTGRARDRAVQNSGAGEVLLATSAAMPSGI